MTSKEALVFIKEQLINNIENEETDECWDEADKQADINWWKDKFQIIQKDLEVLELFKELFDGEDLDGWVEFNFGLTREDEDSIDNYNGFITKLKKIRLWLEEQRKENKK